MHLLGTYTPKLDEKGRIFLPAKFRDELAEGVVVAQGQDGCLVVYPQAVFDEEAAETLRLPRDSLLARQRRRVLGSASDPLKPDKQGRISIQAQLRAHAGLERDVVVAGAIDRLEVWSPERWEQASAEATEAVSNLNIDPQPEG